jgi:alpha-glucosidase
MTTCPNLALRCAGCLSAVGLMASITMAPAYSGDSYTPYRPLLARVNSAGPLYVTGAEAVPPAALAEASRILAAMLRHRPDVALKLRAEGALIAVFARAQNVCDLPYFADLMGKAVCTAASGGLGGVPVRPVTACSEKVLLRQPDNPFGWGQRPDGEEVCSHEIAHLIMNVGLSDAERARIRARYAAVRDEGLWKDTFALTNADEFFAEMSQSYFCTNPPIPTHLHNGVNCAGALRAYDLATAALMDSIYKGTADLR